MIDDHSFTFQNSFKNLTSFFVEEADVVDAVTEHGGFKMAAVDHRVGEKVGVSILRAKAR